MRPLSTPTSIADRVLKALALITILVGAGSLPTHTTAAPQDDGLDALRAIAAALVGKPTAGQVSLPAAVSQNLAALDPVYQHFAPSGLLVRDHGRVDGAQNQYWLRGTIQVENDLRRRASLDVMASYTLNGQTLNVLEAEAVTVPSSFPDVDLFFVPKRHNAAVAQAPNLYHMMAELVKVAVPPEHLDPFGGEYVIYAALRDRMNDGTSVWVQVSDTPDGLGTHKTVTQNIDFAGWRVGVNTAHMTFNAGKTVYVKVIYQPGPTAVDPNPTQRVAHLTTNMTITAVEAAAQAIQSTKTVSKAANLRAAPSLKGKRIGQLAAGSSVGLVDLSADGKWAYVLAHPNQPGYVATSLLSNAVQAAPQSAQPTKGLMSLSQAGNAKAVQQRLADLGFFQGSVDGKWGKASRIALRQFKAMNGLEDSFVWDAETQDVLFPQ